MGKQHISAWQYSIQQFNKLAGKKSYAIRFRLEYAFLLMGNSKAKAFILHALAYLNQLKNIISHLGKFHITHQYDIVFLISDNKAYLQHLLPIIKASIKSRKNVLILTPAKEYKKLIEKVDKSILKYVYICESLKVENGILAAIKSVADIFWFMFQDIKNAFWYSTAFGRYSLIQKSYEKTIFSLLKNTKHLIAANDHWLWESLFFTLAKKAGTKSIVVQHGVTGEFTYPIFADLFAAWGKADVEKLIAEQGAKPTELAAVGSPYFNNIYSKITVGRNPEQQIEKSYITFLAQPFKLNNILVKEYHEILKYFCRLGYKGKELVIKIHPMESVSDYSQFQEIHISTEPLYDVLDKSCLVFTVDSTSIFEAVMFGVPAYQIFVRKQERQIDFFSSGITDRIYTDENISEAISILGAPEKYFAKQQKAFNVLNYYFHNIGEDDNTFPSRLLK